MKILIYGGCHAKIIGEYLSNLYDRCIVDIEILINFELISSQSPFPFDGMGQYDAVIFSPIEHKGVYNTTLIKDYCRARSKIFLCYPWLEWHGYCPGAVKGQFKTRYQWYYPKLVDIARSFDTFVAFHNYVIEHFPDDDTIDQVFRLTSERLRESEQRHAMQVRVTDFIHAEHRAARLFLVSDHPSRRLYVHVLRQIIDVLGLPQPRAQFPDGEPQWQCRSPILPRVASRLGLDFDDPEWVDDLLAPECSSSLENYLRLYFYGDSVVLAPLRHAELVAQTSSKSIILPLDSASRVLASPLRRGGRAGIGQFEFLATLAGPTVALDPLTRFSIERSLWREIWEC